MAVLDSSGLAKCRHSGSRELLDCSENMPSLDIRQRLSLDSPLASRLASISPSRQTPNVLVFSDPHSGERHGYYDTWDEDGVLLYTGEGEKGDQVLQGSNAAFRDHRNDGRALRVFRGSGGEIEYIGEFEVDPDQPFEYAETHSNGDNRSLRTVIVFRLLPVDWPPPDEALLRDGQARLSPSRTNR